MDGQQLANLAGVLLGAMFASFALNLWNLYTARKQKRETSGVVTTLADIDNRWREDRERGKLRFETLERSELSARRRADGLEKKIEQQQGTINDLNSKAAEQQKLIEEQQRNIEQLGVDKNTLGSELEAERAKSAAMALELQQTKGELDQVRQQLLRIEIENSVLREFLGKIKFVAIVPDALKAQDEAITPPPPQPAAATN